MTTPNVESLELSIDTASMLASIARSREGRLVSELTWECRREHSRQLLPAIDALLAPRPIEVTSCARSCLHRAGTYAGCVGVSTAKGLAFGWRCRSPAWAA
jgi:tRNA A37 threonylcarbamoyladenosine modification protein TsaB